MFPMTNIFPVLIIGMSFWSSIVYGLHREPLHAGYWFCAGALNLCVLFMKEI
jgi:hypothetical protein